MKGTLEYRLDDYDERKEFELAVHGREWVMVVNEVFSYLRRQEKNSHQPTVDDIRKFLISEIEERGLNPDAI